MSDQIGVLLDDALVTEVGWSNRLSTSRPAGLVGFKVMARLLLFTMASWPHAFGGSA